MRKTVSAPRQVASNIRKFAAELAENPELQSMLGHVHAWYALRLADGTWTFGPSKFVGYQDNTANNYLETYQETADGRATEHALRRWFSEVDLESKIGRELMEALEEFLARWNRKPRRGIRISVMADESEYRAPPSTRNQALLARISSDPRICGGRPCIKGTRMRVVDIVEAISHGATREQLLRDFGYLSADDITAALLYAAQASDHRVVHTA